MTTITPTAGPARLARLDGLRGLAAVGVAFGYHIRTIYADGALDSGIAAIGWLQVYGWLFVDLFFLLSGYIFAHVYLGRRTLEGPGALADFAVARFARLYPLHLAMLLVTAVLFAGSNPANTLPAFFAHLVMAQALAQPVANSFDGASWSISVEVVCYIIFALAAASGARALRLATGGALAIALLALILHAAPDGPYARDIFPRGLMGFFLGQVLWHRRAFFARVPGWALAGLIALGMALPPAWLGAILPLALLVFPAGLLLALRCGWLESPVFAWLGDRSYTIYLVHAPMLDLFVQARGKLGGSAGEVVLGHIGAISAILVVSDLVYRGFERPARVAIRSAWESWQARPEVRPA